MLSLSKQYFKDFRMAKKDTKLTGKYLDEDILFLMLKLIDYPDCELKTFNFDELDLLNFKKPISYLAFQAISEIKSFSEIQLSNFQFDRYGVFYSDKKGIKNHFHKVIYENKSKKTVEPLKNLLENNFTLSDLEQLEKEQKFRFPLLLGGVNFKITVTQKLQEDLIDYLKGYTKIFEKGKLQKTTNPYFVFADHKKIFQEKVSRDYDKYKSINIVLNDFEFEKDFRLLECVLILDFHGDIKINSIVSKKNSNGKNSFVVSIDLSDEFLKKIGKFSKVDKPKCFIDDRFTFFQINKNTDPIKIGNAKSEKCRLLKCLTDFFERERTIETAFEIAYKKGFDRKTGKDPNQFSIPEKIKIIKGTWKELQRDGKLKGFQIKFGKFSKAIKMTFAD